eukprot:gene22576-30841_t
MKWSLNQLLPHAGVINVAITGITIDSRQVESGYLYIAIEGEFNDGHSFVCDADVKGAAAIVVHKPITDYKGKAPLIQVADTLEALHQISAFIRGQSTAKVVAITGSVGKTSTKEMLRHVLSHFGSTVASKASFNNHWGVPLSLLELRPDTSYGVFEVGMNHAGEIEPLSRLITPHLAIITTIGAAHIGYMGSLEAIADEKSALFKGMPTDLPGTAVIINQDTALVERMTAHAKPLPTLFYSLNSPADVQLIETTEQFDRSNNIHVKAKVMDKIIDYTLLVFGMHHVANSLAILAVCHQWGLDLVVAAAALTTFEVPEGRGDIHKVRISDTVQIVVVDDAYNANPLSMKAGMAALQNINKSLGKRRCIAVLGEMLELGDNAAAYHAELAETLIKADVDLVLCCGEHMQHLYEKLPPEKQCLHAQSADQLLQPLLDMLRDGDLVYAKGSKGSRVKSVVVDHLRHQG